jgi:hypothetical protein
MGLAAWPDEYEGLASKLGEATPPLCQTVGLDIVGPDIGQSAVRTDLCRLIRSPAGSSHYRPRAPASAGDWPPPACARWGRSRMCAGGSHACRSPAAAWAHRCLVDHECGNCVLATRSELLAVALDRPAGAVADIDDMSVRMDVDRTHHLLRPQVPGLLDPECGQVMLGVRLAHRHEIAGRDVKHELCRVPPSVLDQGRRGVTALRLQLGVRDVGVPAGKLGSNGIIEDCGRPRNQRPRRKKAQLQYPPASWLRLVSSACRFPGVIKCLVACGRFSRGASNVGQ